MIDKEFLDKLKPVEIDYIAEYLMYKLYSYQHLKTQNAPDVVYQPRFPTAVA